DLSNHRSHVPTLRALAKLALEREEYSKVVEYFDEAVRLNPVFGGDWFSLGYAAMRLEQWGRSGEAFTRVCQIQPNDAYAWNNLASVLLRDGRLRPAFNAMSQALRNNRRDWRMWQNYFSIGCELKEVTETTNALNVLLEIAKRNTQLERESLHRFVDNAIAYMEGRIPASSKDQMEGVEESHLFASLMEDEEEQKHV
ncbi:tetratricopeptide repeat domain 27, partial [Trypanosoma cruzi]